MEPGDIRQRAATLLAELRRDTNGASSSALTQRGIVYNLNYGVSLPDIKNTSRRFGTDHELALHLRTSGIRELRLASFFIADLNMMDAGDLPGWREGVTNSETAEVFARNILTYFADSPQVVSQWLDDPDDNIKYSALLALTGYIGRTPEFYPKELMEKIPAIVTTSSSTVARACGRLLGRLVENGTSETTIKNIISRLPSSEGPGTAAFFGELENYGIARDPD